MGFMKPSSPPTPVPVQTIPVKAESVNADAGEDYQAREKQRKGMVPTILARRNSTAGGQDVNPQTLLRKTLG